jgi:site-specific DNA-methyltransferase (adenine-specific)
MPHRVFTGANSTLIQGDALEVLDQEVKDGSVDLIFADPPYNIGKRFAGFVDRWESDSHYLQWCEQWLGICLDKLKPSGSLYLMASTQAMPALDLFLRERIHILSRIVWCYDSSGVQARARFGSMYEPILHCVKDRRNYTFNAREIMIEARTGAERKLVDYRKKRPSQYSSQKVPGNVWCFPRVRYRMPEYEQHPSQKPEALLERIIKASSNPDDLVLDPYAGTFTTCAIAQRLGRRSIGIEREFEYVKIGLRRLGIRQRLDGELLVPPEKTYLRKNGAAARTDSGLGRQ